MAGCVGSPLQPHMAKRPLHEGAAPYLVQLVATGALCYESIENPSNLRESKEVLIRTKRPFGVADGTRTHNIFIHR